MQLRKILYIWIALLLLASASLSAAFAEEPVSVMEPEVKPEAAEVNAEANPEVKVIQDGVQVKEPDLTPEGKEAKGTGPGDTYNFYFQKSPGANKVEQGKTQSVEQLPAPQAPAVPDYAPISYSNEPKVGDFYLGLSFLLGKSTKGLTLGGEFLPQNTVGARIGLIMASSTNKQQYNKSKKSIFDSDEVTDKNELFGADAALTFNLINNRKGKLAPMLGFMAFNEKDTTETEHKHFWGSDDSKQINSNKFRFLPYVGLSGTAYLTRTLGINVAIAVPSVPKYTTTHLSMVLSI